MLTKNFVSREDVNVAVALYNDIRTTLEESGWSAETGKDVTTPGYWWTHPNHPGKFSMSAAHGRWRLDVERLKPDGDRALNLDKYERDNLLSLLHLIYRHPEGPFCLATGDWIGQLYWRLAEKGFQPELHTPNEYPEELLVMLLNWARPLVAEELSKKYR